MILDMYVHLYTYIWSGPSISGRGCITHIIGIIFEVLIHKRTVNTRFFMNL